MFTIVTSLVFAASAASLIGGATSAPTQLVFDAPAHEHSAPLHHTRQITALAVSLNVAGTSGRLQGPPPPPLGDHTCARINADGVRIHSTFSVSSAVVGLAYKGDLFKIADFPGGGWQEGTDMHNGVHGWVASDFVDLYMVHC